MDWAFVWTVVFWSLLTASVVTGLLTTRLVKGD